MSLALALVLTVGTASADTFEVVPSEPAATTADVFAVVATEGQRPRGSLAQPSGNAKSATFELGTSPSAYKRRL